MKFNPFDGVQAGDWAIDGVVARARHANARKACFICAPRRKFQTATDITPAVTTSDYGGAGYGSAKVNTLGALPCIRSGATRSSAPATPDGPVITATYCLPS